MNITQLLISAGAALIAGFLLPGVEIAFIATIVVAIVLAFANTYVLALMAFFGLPTTVLMVGLFTLVMNAALLMALSAILPRFKVRSFWSAIIFAIIMAVVTAILNYFF